MLRAGSGVSGGDAHGGFPPAGPPPPPGPPAPGVAQRLPWILVGALVMAVVALLAYIVVSA